MHILRICIHLYIYSCSVQTYRELNRLCVEVIDEVSSQRPWGGSTGEDDTVTRGRRPLDKQLT